MHRSEWLRWRGFRRPHKCHKCRFQQVPRMILNFDENSLLPVRATYGLRLCRFSDYTQTHGVIFLSCYQVQHTCVFTVFLCMQRLLINKMVCVIATINIHFGNFLPPLKFTDRNHWSLSLHYEHINTPALTLRGRGGVVFFVPIQWWPSSCSCFIESIDHSFSFMPFIFFSPCLCLVLPES